MNGQRRRLTAGRHAARLTTSHMARVLGRYHSVQFMGSRRGQCQAEDISWREQGGRLIDLHPGCAQARTELAYETAE
jgi:hypothetical protein